MLYRMMVLGLMFAMVSGCATPENTIGVEEKFRGDTRNNLEIGDTPVDEANSSSESEAACIDAWISDGWCDIQNNNEVC